MTDQSVICKGEIMAPKFVDKNEKIEAIIEAATQVMSQKGYHPTKMDDIAKKADMGKGTLYQYFKSKEEVFEAIITSFFNEYEQLFTLVMTMPIKKGFSFIIDTIFNMAEKEKQSIDLMIHIFGHSSESSNLKIHNIMKDFYERFLVLFSQFIEKAWQKDKIKTHTPPIVLARIIMSTLDGLLLQIMLFPLKVKEERKQIKETLLNQWLR